MATYRISLTAPGESGMRLVDLLCDALPGECAKRGIDALSRSKIRRLVIAGAVTVNGRTIRVPAAPVGKGCALTAVIDTELAYSEREPDDIAFELDGARVLYEDDAIVVVDKPAGLPSEATVVASRDHLLAAVRRYLHRVSGSRNEPYAGLLHRLDRETSGVIILTKRRDANAALHAQFLGHSIRKEYLALAARPTSRPCRGGETFRVDNLLARVTAKSARGKWGAVRSGGDEAITDFEIDRVFPGWLAVKAFPLTGRTHQIRVHLSGLGYPILGDALYGGPTKVDDVGPTASGSAVPERLAVPRVMLHARSISFLHPVDGRELVVSAPIPVDFLPFLA